MKRFFLSMKYLVNDLKNHRNGSGLNPAKGANCYSVINYCDASEAIQIQIFTAADQAMLLNPVCNARCFLNELDELID